MSDTYNSDLDKKFKRFINKSNRKFHERYPGFKRNKHKAYKMVKNDVTLPERYHLLNNAKSLDLKLLRTLPERFIIKSVKGSGGLQVICTVRLPNNKYQDVLHSPKVYNEESFLKHVRKITGKKKVIIEEFLQDAYEIPLDYKVYVVKGKAKLISVYKRSYDGNSFQVYDTNWQRFPAYDKFYVRNKYPEEKEDFKLAPIETRQNLLKLAEKLGRKHKALICRYDFYCVKDTVYFGEITPQCGGITYHKIRKSGVNKLYPKSIRK